MLPARLDKKIVFKSVVNTNSYGDLIPVENTFTSTMATKTSKTTVNEEGLITEYVNFYIRYIPNIKYTYFIYCDDCKYRIVTINEVGRKEALSIDCERLENQ